MPPEILITELELFFIIKQGLYFEYPSDDLFLSEEIIPFEKVGCYYS
jgi:hypothetical protein